MFVVKKKKKPLQVYLFLKSANFSTLLTDCILKAFQRAFALSGKGVKESEKLKGGRQGEPSKQVAHLTPVKERGREGVGQEAASSSEKVWAAHMGL